MFRRIEDRKVNIGDQEYSYTLRRKPRVKYLRLSIEHDGSLTLTAPITYPVFMIRSFLASRYKWITDNVAKVRANPTILGIKHSTKEINHYKRATRKLVRQRMGHFNSHYQFRWNRIAIRNQSSRWGSCSSAKNLNFNYRLALLPAELADYIIVHEMCHLAQMNHSSDYWQLVLRAIPDYKEKQKRLKKI